MTHAGWKTVWVCGGCGHILREGEISPRLETYHDKQKLPCIICPSCKMVNDHNSIIKKSVRNSNPRARDAFRRKKRSFKA